MRTRKSQGGGHRWGRSGMKGQAYHGGSRLASGLEPPGTAETHMELGVYVPVRVLGWIVRELRCSLVLLSYPPQPARSPMLSGRRYPAMAPIARGISDADYPGRVPRGAGTESPSSPRRSCGWNPW